MVDRIATMDKAGRVVIPKEIREKMNLKEDSTLIVTEAEGDVLILKRLDVEGIAERLRAELKGKDVESIARRVREESNERARKEHRSLRR